jgi:methionyl aminopeptidase
MLLRKARPILLAKHELPAMRRAGGVAAELLHTLGAMVRPGLTTQDLDDAAVKFARDRGLINAPLGYGHPPFPRSICTSPNDVVCHGIPSDRVTLRDGDIVAIDVTPIVEGYHGDTCATFYVGQPAPEVVRLVETCGYGLRAGLRAVVPGRRLNDIGRAIQPVVEGRGYSVVRDFVGHAIGRVFHGAMQVEHVASANPGPRLQPGMAFTIEPMVNMGRPGVEVLDDQWTAITSDGSWSAQFEHTMVVTDTGVEVMTRLPGEDSLRVSPGGVVHFQG